MSESVEPAIRHYRKTKFHGELRFVLFADYEGHGNTIMVYTREAFDARNNPGPIGFIPVSKLPRVEPASAVATNELSFAYAYSPRENDGSRGKYHAVTRRPLWHGRLRRAEGDPLCKPARKFWGLDSRSREKFDSYPCKRCKKLGVRLGLL